MKIFNYILNKLKQKKKIKKISFKSLNLDIIKIYFIIYVYFFLFLLRIYSFKIINSNIFLNF